MKSEERLFLIIMVLGLTLLVLDRVYRIGPFFAKEGFDILGNSQIQMCGVDHPPCNFPLRCANGFCRSDEQKVLTERRPLPVVP